MNHYSAQSLFHRNDPETSKEAAVKMVKSGKLISQEETVYRAIKAHLEIEQTDTFTAKEILSVGYFTIQRRLSGLHRQGKIERTGERREGCCVWRLKNDS